MWIVLLITLWAERVEDFRAFRTLCISTALSNVHAQPARFRAHTIHVLSTDLHIETTLQFDDLLS